MAKTAVEFPLKSDTTPATRGRAVWAIVLIVGSTLPLFALHLEHLWAKPHYQFYPLLLLGIAGLVWQRWPRRALVFRSSRLGMTFLLLGLVVLAAGALLFSPWLAAVASLVTTLGLILSLADSRARREWLPVWALLWILIPPPMSWDQHAVTHLQSMTSRAGSLTLDVLGVGHLMEGNVLVLPGHRLLVEEACSGINSLFTLLAITALFVVATRRPWIWVLALLASSVCWAGVTNAARVVTVAVAQASVGLDLSSGWAHTALGLTTTCVALLMVLSTDRLLAFLLGPIVPVSPDDELNPLSRAWNWCVGGIRSGAGEWDPEEEDTEIDDQPDTPVSSFPSAAADAGASGGLRVPRWIVVSFVALGALQLGGLTVTALRQASPWAAVQRLGRRDLFRGPDLPATLAGWTQVRYTTEEHQGNFGDFRQVWTYHSSKEDCLISVAYPFRGWHDLRECYSLRGWRILTSVQQTADSEADKTDPYLKTQMHSPGGEEGLMLFSLVDQAGRAVAIPRPAIGKGLLDRLAGNPLWSFLPKASLAKEPATFQVQALIVSQDALPAAQQQAVQRLFVAARQTLLSAYHQQRKVGDE